MLEKYDSLAITPEIADKMTEDELKKVVAKRDELIKKMSDDEIKELMKRPLPPQYKIKIQKLREE